MGELREGAQRIQIRQLGEVVRRQDQGGEVGDRLGQRGLDACDAVAGEQEGTQARREREVGELHNVVVGEVDGILVLFREHTGVSMSAIADCSYRCVYGPGRWRRNGGWDWFGAKYLGNAQVLDGGDLVSYGSSVMISMELNPKSVVSVLFSNGTHLGDRARVL